MDQAFLDLLAEKDFAYITVKEICQRAKVNRSTFYLHYETLADLLEESVEAVMEKFYQCFPAKNSFPNISSCPLDKLFLITPQYLIPYLSYIRDNKKLFQTMVQQAKLLGLKKTYRKLFEDVLEPILQRFQVPSHQQHYLMMFYITGILSIVMEWVKNGCADPIEEIVTMIECAVNSEHFSKLSQQIEPDCKKA